MKKILLLIIALTIVGNTGDASCLRNMKKLTKSLTKIVLYRQNGMNTNEEIEASSTKFFAINVIAECTGDDNHMKGARATGTRALKMLK